MLKKVQSLIFGVVLIALFGIQVAVAKEPSPNLSVYKKQLRQYYTSGEYANDVNAVTHQASVYLKKRVARNKIFHKKLAVVFDIDETALSNLKVLEANNFAFPLKQLQQNQKFGQLTAVPGTLRLYKIAAKNKVAIFFIAARAEKSRELTIKNLNDAGYTHWTGLILLPDNFKGDSVASFKTSERKKIENQGYDIVLNMGSQQSDLKGGYADRTFKLPNPFYYIP